MPIQLFETHGGKILQALISGKLIHEDYQQFVPVFERLQREHGRISVLVEMAEFHGWQGGALWDDIKFDIKHFSHIERLAMVGEKQWEKNMSVLCKPFTTAEVRYFDRAQLPNALAWLEETVTQGPSVSAGR